MLGYLESDFKFMNTKTAEFNNYLQFWEFSEKWHRLCEIWKVQRFDHLINNKELKIIIFRKFLLIVVHFQ